MVMYRSGPNPCSQRGSGAELPVRGSEATQRVRERNPWSWKILATQFAEFSFSFAWKRGLREDNNISKIRPLKRTKVVLVSVISANESFSYCLGHCDEFDCIDPVFVTVLCVSLFPAFSLFSVFCRGHGCCSLSTHCWGSRLMFCRNRDTTM